MAKKELSFVPPDGSFTLMDYRVERPQGSSLSGAGLVPITLKPIVILTDEGGMWLLMDYTTIIHTDSNI